MYQFRVRKGAHYKVLTDASQNLGEAFEGETSAYHVFSESDVYIAPNGKLGEGKPGDATTAGFLARSRFLGFRLQGRKWGRFEGQLFFAQHADIEYREV